jgi:hypothetical protein
MHKASMPVHCDLRTFGDLDWAAVGRYVLGRRTAQGGYCFYRTPEWGVEEPNAVDTLAALQSLGLLGIDVPAVEQTGAWLRGLQDDDGGYPTLTIGWAALRALDVLTIEPKFSPDRWLGSRLETFARSDRPRDWRAAIIDALRLCELMRLRHSAVRQWERDNLVELITAARAPHGGWAAPGADLETTAIAVQLIGLLDPHRRPDPPLGTFLDSCEDEQLGLRLAPGTRTTSVGALWGGLTLGHALGRRLRYLGAVGEQLGLLQRPDGGLSERHWAISTLRATWLGLQAAHLLNRQRQEQG